MISKGERERRLDAIRQHADRLNEISRGYDRLRWMAEQETSSDAFLALAETAGIMTLSFLQQTATLLEILWKAGSKEGAKP